MKKLLFICFLALCSFHFVQAQNLNISGIVTDLQGNPRVNHPVQIYGDSLSFQYSTTVFTNSNGFYSDLINVTNASVVDFFVMVEDSCNFHNHWNIVSYNGSVTNFPNNNFSICHPYSGSCSASFTYSYGSSTSTSQAVHFSSIPSGFPVNANLKYHWDFGNGSSSTAANPFRWFNTSNPTYNVCLTVTDYNTGCSDTYCQTINSSSCQTSFSVNYLQPNYIQINHPYPGFSYSRMIDYGDGTTPTPALYHIYNTPGTYNVCMTLSNNQIGCTATYCDTVTITVPTTCDANLINSSNILDKNYFSTDGSVGAAPFSYMFDYGDGTTGGSHFHNYPANGSYYATVTITTATGCIDTAGVWLMIDSMGTNCSTSFIANQTSSGQFNFLANSFGVYPLTHSWDFGDGTMGSGVNPSHTYQSSGAYIACLTTTDSAGCVSTYCDTLVISPVCNVSVSGNTFYPNGNTGSFTANATGTAPFTYFWDYGDGFTHTNTNNVNTATHTYGQSGNYQVCVTATDALGCQSSSCTTIQIDSCDNFDIHTQNNGNNSYSFSANTNNTIVPVGYSWNFGDGNASTLANPTHIYTNNGIYQVCLTLSDSVGCTATQCDTVSIGIINPCQVSFTWANSTSTYNPYRAYFYSNYTGQSNPISRFWDFGDGSSSSGLNAVHNYSSAGFYYVCLTITDSIGCVSTYCDTIEVGFNDSCSLDLPTTLVGTTTSGVNFQANVTSQVSPYFIQWRYGDGVVDTTYNSGNTSYQYNSPGLYMVYARARDFYGCRAWDSVLVVIDTCYTSFDFQNQGGNTYSFTATTVNQTTPINYYWDFGNGDSSFLANPTYTFLTTGWQNVCLTTTDSSGCTYTYCDWIYVSNSSNCSVILYHSNDSTTLLTNFSAYATGAAPFTYTWNFGDGSPIITTTTPYANYGYALNGGSYVACVTVTDSSGCSSTDCNTVFVIDTSSSSCYLSTDFTYQVNNSNGTVNFTSNVYNATNPVAYHWDFGDGNFSTQANPTHVYNSSGNYIVTLTSTDTNGCTGYYCVYVSVQVGGVGYNCNAAFTYNINPNGIVFFNNNSNGIAPLNYAWSFGDGNTSFAANPSHAYNASGTYVVCLGLTDGTGCTSYECDTIIVQVPQNNCSADFTYQIDSVTGAVSFTSSATGNGPFSYWWDFGDGTTSTLANPTHNYTNITNINNLSTCLTITDSSGCIAYHCDTLNIYTGNCFSTFTYQITGNTVSFVPLTIGQAPFTYVWYFGDGSVSTSATPTHTYSGSGSYSVCLATVDASGCLGSYCLNVNIAGSNGCSSYFTYQNVGNGTVTFNAVTQNGQAPFTYQWNFGDGTTSSIANPTHTYTTNGWYLPSLTVTDSTGCSSTFYDTLYIQLTGNCSADLSYYTIGNTDTLSFNVGTTGQAPFSYSWDFGDGNTSSLANPYHSFNTSSQDTFYVCVTITDSSGCTATDCEWIIPPDSCAAPCGFTYQLQSNGTVSFVSIASMLGSPIPFGFYWDFGNGDTSTQANPNYTYTSSGNYLVMLTVTNLLTGCSTTCYAYVSVQVNGVGYNCNANFTYQQPLSGLIYFQNNSSGLGGLTYLWDFGNGDTSTQANPIYNYSTAGNYIVCLTIVDVTGCNSSFCDTININAQANCTASFNTQYFHYTGTTQVQFTANATGGNGIYSYIWDFSTGTPSIGPTAYYTYTSTGYYPVCLTVSDSAGCFATYCDTIFVQVNTNSCQADFMAFDSLGTVYFMNQSSGTNGMTTYSWDFGDGTTSTSHSPVHQYASSGYYIVCLTILDNLGCTDTYCDSIYIHIPQPTCDVTLTASLTPNTSFVTYTATPNGQGTFGYRWNFFGNGFNGNPWFPAGTGYLYHGVSDTTVYTCVEVTDLSTGCIDTACISVYIPDTAACLVDFTYMTDTNGVVNFYATANNGQAPYAFIWDMGDGTTHTLQNPSHTYPHSGNFWACVTITDSVGCTNTYCDTVVVPPFTSTNNIEQLTDITIFPNPVKDILNINFTLMNNTDVEITVLNATGQMIDQQHINAYSGENQTTISTNELPIGVYLLRIQSNDGTVTKRFVKH